LLSFLAVLLAVVAFVFVVRVVLLVSVDVSSVCRIAFLALLRGCHLPSSPLGDAAAAAAAAADGDSDDAIVFLDGDDNDNGDEAEDFFPPESP
jgi:hypothetical protein